MGGNQANVDNKLDKIVKEISVPKKITKNNKKEFDDNYFEPRTMTNKESKNFKIHSRKIDS